MEYIILLLLVILITLFCEIFDINTKNNKLYLLSVIVILTLFLGFRGPTVGLDMGNYHKFFIQAKESTFSFLCSHYDFELGFKILTKLMTFIFFDFRFYILIISIISMIGIYNFIKNYSKNYFASIYLFITFNYFIYYTCTLRQCLAISILLLSFAFLKEQKLFKYVITVLIASLFHKTALVFLLLPLFKFVRITPKRVIYYISFCIILFAVKNPIIKFLTATIYDQYLNYRNTSGSGYAMIILITVLIIGICVIDKPIDMNKSENKYLVGMLLLALPFQVLSTTQGLIARIVLYFNYSLIALIPNKLEIFNIKYINKLYILFYISLFAFYIYQILTNSVYVDYNLF